MVHSTDESYAVVAAALEFVQNEAPDVFEVTHLDDKILSTSSNLDMVLLFFAAKRQLIYSEKPTDNVSIRAAYKTGAQFLFAIRALFSKT